MFFLPIYIKFFIHKGNVIKIETEIDLENNNTYCFNRERKFQATHGFTLLTGVLI